jgi:hypothetical protein
MVKFRVAGIERKKDVRGNPRILVRLQAAEADGFGSEEENAAPPAGEIVMLVTDDEATRFSLDECFTLRAVAAPVEGS